MKTSTDLIRTWLQEGKEDKATHVAVFSDDFSHEYYPVSYHSREAAQAGVREKDGKNMQRVIEVYNLSMDWNKQLRADRSFNY